MNAVWDPSNVHIPMPLIFQSKKTFRQPAYKKLDKASLFTDDIFNIAWVPHILSWRPDREIPIGQSLEILFLCE